MLRDPAGLVAVGEGRGVFVATPVVVWVGVELGVSPTPQPDSSKPRTTIHTITINLICLMFMFLLSLLEAYELMKVFQPSHEANFLKRGLDGFPILIERRDQGRWSPVKHCRCPAVQSPTKG
jgi:hypothetical protein